MLCSTDLFIYLLLLFTELALSHRDSNLQLNLSWTQDMYSSQLKGISEELI